MKKRSKFHLYTILALLFVVVAAGYLYLPSILGDTIYPLKYADFIRKYANEYSVDPALIAGVIRQESNFNPNAHNSSGAKGLSQFMDGTARTVATEVGRTTYNIYDPETAVQLCARHLKDLLDKYNGNVDAALAGYNAGTGNADRWLRLGILGDLPFGETRNYVKNVKEYQQIYASFYSHDLYGVDATIKIDKPKQDFLWSRMVTDLVGVIYGK
jgi:soluble lytic murein transglycosylase